MLCPDAFLPAETTLGKVEGVLGRILEEEEEDGLYPLPENASCARRSIHSRLASTQRAAHRQSTW